MDPEGEAWAAFAEAAPDIAAAGRRLLEDAPGVPGVAFLATTGPTALPRIHPFIPAIVDSGLWAFVVESPKRRDLDRTGTYAVHSRLGQDDESFYCAGRARPVDAGAAVSRVASVMPYSDIDERHRLYELRVARVLWTTWTSPTSPVHRRWTLASG